MKVESMINGRADRGGRTFHDAFVALAAAATLFLAPAAARAADPGGPGPVGKSPAVTLESIPGTTAKRVILSAKAGERLGIETGRVGEEPVVLKQMVSGLVIPPLGKQPKPSSGVFGGIGRVAGASAPKLTAVGFGGFRSVAATSGPQSVASAVPVPQPVAPRATSPAAGDVWVLVTLSPAEWDRLAKDKPGRLLPLATRDKLKSELWAKPSGMAPLEDMKRSMLSLYYVVPGKDHGLTIHNRLRVELQLSGSNEKKKVVPYGAVYYDAKGDAWVYVNTKPLAFERRRVDVERVEGDLAFLSDGPPVGTPVVTVGAALLYGTEIFGK
ncbi:MAG TPA: hypothetical protein VJ386_07845 [Candidatus Deferrimicrobiaceae bacterium]|jgi:hypothetical protein|nr:hypothetical protein [Candidatus Deferrimicrobiaceae bacterium]